MALAPRIDKWRFVKALRPHIGEEAASEVGDALEDDVQQFATKTDLEQQTNELKLEMWKALAIFTGILLTALSVAVAVIVALA